MIQQAPKDKAIFFVTGLCLVLLSLFLILAIYLFASGADAGKIIPFVAISVILVAILTYRFFAATIAYEIEGSQLKIIRKRRSIVYPLTEIKDAKLIDKNDLGSSFRMGANGGVFGYSGIIYSKNYGSVSIYLNSFEKDLILIHLSNRTTPILIHPENGASFVAELNKTKRIQ